MHSLVALIALSAAMFAATNLDGLFVLMAFYADPAHRGPQIVAGHYLGMGILFGASLALSLAALAVPPSAIGWLGLVPIGLGLKKLWDLHAGRGAQPAVPGNPGRGVPGALVVAAVTVANGGDNIGVYVPQFAIHSGRQVLVMGLVFAVFTGLWCALASAVLAHPSWGPAIRAQGHRWVPWGLIALGLWTLFEAGIL